MYVLVFALLMAGRLALAQMPDPVAMAKQAGIYGIEDAYKGENPAAPKGQAGAPAGQPQKQPAKENPNVLRFDKGGSEAARQPAVNGGGMLDRNPIVVRYNLGDLKSDNAAEAPRRKAETPFGIEPGRCYYLRGCKGDMKITKACLDVLQYVDCGICGSPEVKQPYGCP